MNKITPDSDLGGQDYPFLAGRDWVIQSDRVQDDPEWLSEIILDEDVAVEYCKGGSVTRITCDGLKLDQFLESAGLECSILKTSKVFSKRMSRIMRPYFCYGFFTNLKVEYDATMDKIQWDGAGLISRKALGRLRHTMHRLPSRKRKRLDYALRTLKRVEFTVMTERGQDKGHAYVVDEDVPWDLKLPLDTKGEIKLVNGTQFLGILPVHSVDHMNLDVQSHVNLGNTFWDISKLESWLQAEAKLFLESIRSEKAGELMGRISSTDERGEWWVKDYLAMGGKAMWSTSIVKAIAAQHANKIRNTNTGKFKLPVPGGRYYIFSSTVGGKAVADGEATLDPDSGTIWVSATDYPKVASVLGGADQDDALWVMPFTDYDDERKLLCWRSPNQVGEYWIFKPSADSHTIEWQTIAEPIIFPAMDSQLLPTRIDATSTKNLHLVKEVPDTPGPYTLKAMHLGIRQEIANAGALGMLCNLLIVYKAQYGNAPSEMPDLLSEVIDATVKNGNDLQAVKDWVYSHAQMLVRHNPFIPASQHHRIVGLCGKTLAANVRPTTDHWLDGVHTMLAAHLKRFDTATQWLMNRCMMPQEVFAAGEGWTDVAADLRILFRDLMRQQPEYSDEHMAKVTRAIELELDKWSIQQQRHILMALFTRIYLTDRTDKQDENLSDTICWMIGEIGEDEVRKPGIAQRSLDALSYFGVLDELVDSPEGVMHYKRHQSAEVQGQPIKLNGRWFSEALTGESYATMSDVPAHERERMKALIEDAAKQGRYNGQTFTVKAEGQRKVFLSSDGRIWAYVQRGQEYRVPNDTATITFAAAQDGNLHAIVV